MTASSNETLAEHTARARKMALWYSTHSPYRLNPEPAYWEGIVKAIGRQAVAHGAPYCP